MSQCVTYCYSISNSSSLSFFHFGFFDFLCKIEREREISFVRAFDYDRHSWSFTVVVECNSIWFMGIESRIIFFPSVLFQFQLQVSLVVKSKPQICQIYLLLPSICVSLIFVFLFICHFLFLKPSNGSFNIYFLLQSYTITNTFLKEEEKKEYDFISRILFFNFFLYRHGIKHVSNAQNVAWHWIWKHTKDSTNCHIVKRKYIKSIILSKEIVFISIFFFSIFFLI